MPNNPRRVEIIKKETPFKGYFQLDQYILRHELFAGGMGPEISREIFERGHAACIVPYDPVRDEVVLIEQFRPGAYAADHPSAWLIEVVAGIIETGETAENVVVRESLEEAQLTVTDVRELGTYLMTPGGSSESMAMFVGCCSAEGAGGIHGLADEGEDIRVFTVGADEAIAMTRDGRIANAMTALALMLFETHRRDLRREWS